MTWPILGPGVSYLQKLTWSGLCRLDPIVNFPLGLTWSIPADWILCQFGFISRDCIAWSLLGPGVNCLQRLAWSGFVGWTLLSVSVWESGLRGLTWPSPFRLDPGVSMVPVQVWLGPVFQTEPWLQLGLLGRHVYTQPRVMTLYISRDFIACLQQGPEA